MGLLYKRIAFVDSPLTLTATTLDAINSNQNTLVLDVDLTAGSIVINLPSITSLMFGAGASLNGAGTLVNGAFKGGGGMTFYINGNIVAEGGGVNHSLSFVAYNVNTASEVDVDVICGAANATVGGLGHDVGTCFQVFITGRHSWCILQCVNHGS